MVSSNNWTKDAALEILDSNDSFSIENLEAVSAIIEKHCPFQKDITYEPVTENSRKIDEINKKIDDLIPQIKYIRSQIR